MVFITFMEVFRYLDATPSSRSITEGQEVLNANHIIRVGLKNVTQTELNLYALCLKSSALREAPHQIEGWLALKGQNIEIKNFECSCKAGKSTRCKHIAALLLHCTRCNVLEFDKMSCTDLECYWKKEKAKTLQDYEPVPICETVEVKKMPSVGKTSKYTSIKLNEDRMACIVKELCAVAPNCSLAKHKKGRASTNTVSGTAANILCVVEWAKKSSLLQEIEQKEPEQDCCKKIYYEKICKGDFGNIAILSAQNKDLWRAERKFRITGSRCYELYTYSKDDWDVKSLKYFWPKNEYCLSKNVYIQHGVATEGEARSCYQRVYQHTIVETGLIISNTHPWLAYTPDGVVMENGRPIKLLEIKCPFLGKSQPIEEVVDTCDYFTKNEAGNIILKARHKYYGQVQLGMVVLNIEVCDFVVYSSFSKSFVCVKVMRDKQFCKSLVCKLQNIYFNKMIHVICANKDQYS